MTDNNTLVEIEVKVHSRIGFIDDDEWLRALRYACSMPGFDFKVKLPYVDSILIRNKSYEETIRGMAIVTVELTDEQINLILDVLKESRDDLAAVLKESEGLNDETIRDMQLRHTQINDCIRELQFFAIVNNK